MNKTNSTFYSCTFFTLTTLLFLTIQVQAQARGKIRIIDAKMLLPLAGANIITPKGVAITNEDGECSIKDNLPSYAGDTITVSFIGYHTQKIKLINLQDTVIYMTPKEFELDEVVITGNNYLRNRVRFEVMPTMKYGVYGFGYALVGDSIFVIGGDESNFSEYHNYFNIRYNGIIQIYNIKTSKWHYPKLNVSKRAYHNVHYFDNKIFILGGKRLGKNRNIEFLNETLEVLPITCDTTYVSKVNPHQAINFASGIFDHYLVTMNGSIKMSLNKKTYTRDVHLLDLKTGKWYKQKKIPFAYETTGIVVDSILYQVGGFNNQAVPFMNSYNINTESYFTEGTLPLMERPALAYNEQQKVIYMFEDETLIVYDLLNREMKRFKINLKCTYSGMVYKNGFLYIIGGRVIFQGDNNEDIVVPSNYLIRIDIEEFNKTRSYTMKMKPRVSNIQE